MVSHKIKDLFTSFSPSLDFLAVASGDCRIKIWDTLKGQLQTDLADIILTDNTVLSTKPGSGHLSLDYKCMKWISLEQKEIQKRKLGYSLLLLGTGSGDLLALDVSSGHLKWRVCDCHPGGVSGICFSGHVSHIYTAGVDGMVCQIDCVNGSLLQKFRASTKALSSISLSPDGKTLATAAGQLKTFSCTDFKKVQKFSGHPTSVRCMIFSEDGKFMLSSAVGERHIAVWKIYGGSRKQPVSCVLSMDHPAVFLDCKGRDIKDAGHHGFFILAVSELGLCYIWHGNNVEELSKTKPTKISLSLEGVDLKNQKSSIPMVFAAKLHSTVKPGCALVSVAYGSLVKPSFEKLSLQCGVDINLIRSHDGILLPFDQSSKLKKGQVKRTVVTALDRANAEDATFPFAKLHDFCGRKRKHIVQKDGGAMTGGLLDDENDIKHIDDEAILNEESIELCMEDRLRSSGIVGDANFLRDRFPEIPHGIFSMSSSRNDDQLWIEDNFPEKKIKAAILSLSPDDAYKLLIVLVDSWKLRFGSGKFVFPWIRSILANHWHYVMSQEPSSHMVELLHEVSRSKDAILQFLIMSSGGLKLTSAHIKKARERSVEALSSDHPMHESDDEDDVADLVYGQDVSQSSTDVDD